MSIETLYQKGNDECATPKWIKEGLFAGWFDPCPLSKGLVLRDGLRTEWLGNKIFINPPYSNVMPWVEKAVLECKKGKTVVLLVKNDSSTKWYAKLHEAGAHFIAPFERLIFNDGKAAPFASVLAVLYPTSTACKYCGGSGLDPETMAKCPDCEGKKFFAILE
jgi:hypothetical protein